MKRNTYILILSLPILALSWSCKSHCPLPSCQIRTEHHHALTFENTKAIKKEAKKEAKRIQQEQKVAEQAQIDSLETSQKKDEQLANLNADSDDNLQPIKEEHLKEKKKPKPKKDKKVKESGVSELDTEQNTKKSASHRKENLNEDETNSEVNQELVSTDKEAKKELKTADKESKRLEKESQEQAKEEAKEGKEADTVYRSRMIKWWKKNQNPKTKTLLFSSFLFSFFF